MTGAAPVMYKIDLLIIQNLKPINFSTVQFKFRFFAILEKKVS